MNEAMLHDLMILIEAKHYDLHDCRNTSTELNFFGLYEDFVEKWCAPNVSGEKTNDKR